MGWRILVAYICYIVHTESHSLNGDILVYSIFFLPVAAAERMPSHSTVVSSDALYHNLHRPGGVCVLEWS